MSLITNATATPTQAKTIVASDIILKIQNHDNDGCPYSDDKEDEPQAIQFFIHSYSSQAAHRSQYFSLTSKFFTG
jgi:hypothetical protein